MSNENILSEMESLFLALADKTRLKLLNLMREEEICVCFFTEVLGESQPKISRHLAYLRNAGIVSARREGKWMHYSIEVPANFYTAKILQDALEWLKSQENMREDYKKLKEVCCATEVPITIARAPKPETFTEANVNFEQKEELETFLL
ncbi:MAG: metalloregulator ArsR/SmtB family transcription factor [Acidobacteria bacterium]|jgi:ArsR family transcriptional regulator|nr:metalloregulator ArsR/SmtB family transcription factor [Acidobacteriota bacterium]